MKVVSGKRPPKMVKCPACKGRGMQEIESTTISPGKPVEKSVTKMLCFTCKGAAVITPAKMKAIEEEAALWCSCKEADLMNSTFCDDGTCSDCEKHHYHCGACNKICQVG